MQIKQVFLLLFSIVLTINFCSISFAERKLLNPPVLLSFNPEEYLDEDYKQSLKKLKELFEKNKDDKSVNIISTLYKTARKDSSRKLIKELTSEIQKYAKKNNILFNEIDSNLKKIVQKIEEGSFNKYQTGISFEVDEKSREYVVSWEENGKEIVKRTPFVPEMKLIVQGKYLSPKEDNRKIMVYQYEVENKKESKASFTQLYLESKFPQDYILNKIKNKYGTMSRVYEKSRTIKQDISYPEGYLNYFRLFNFNFVNELLINYHPGQKMDYPFELDEIEGGSPGIIKCYIPIADIEFNPHAVISGESSPEIISDFLATKPDTRTKYMFYGNTIGPVPILDPFDKTKFIEQIISYNNQSIEEGWNNKDEVIQFTKDGLERIKKNLDDKGQIKEFVIKLEEYYKKDMILSEAYVLLRYNLEYLLSKI